jgi:hypothetical protein
MIEVEGPDGAIIEFPDDMPHDAIKSVMAKHYGTGTPAAPEPAPAPSQAQAEFDKLPWYGKAGQAAQDVARMGVEGLTFGFSDKLGAKMGELVGAGSYDENLAELRRETQGARDRMGMLGTGVEIAGQIAGPAKMLGAAKALPGASKVATTLSRLPAAKTATAVGGGAALGALDAAGHDKDIGTGAVIGGAAGAAGRVLAPVVGKVAGAAGRALGVNKAPQIMTRDQIKEAAEAAYKASDDAGVILKPQALQRFAKEVQDDLAEFGYMPELQPKVGSVLNRLNEMSQENVTLKGVDQLRKAVGMLSGSENRSEGAVGRQIVKKIDKFLDDLDATDILTGNKTQGVTALQQARKLWASQRKSEIIEEALEKAKNNAAVSGTGGNIDNAIRQQFRSILNSPKKSRGLTRDERAAMEAIVRGTKGQNLARLLGRLSPQGNGLMLLLHGVGGIGSGGTTLPLAGVGAVAKTIADRATPANVARLDQITRAGGQASAIQPSLNAVQRLAKAKGGALVRGAGVVGLRPDEEQY